MKKEFKKLISAVLSSVMLASGFVMAPVSTSAAASMTAGGWFETIYADISSIYDSDVTAVSYSGTSNGKLTGDALTYLVRDNGNGGVRIDIPGVKAGIYTLTVTANGKNITEENISVMKYDRSGYAHYGDNLENGGGVGAYDNNGELKANAIVLYVTDDNKDTVSVSSSDGTTVTGIGHILNSTGQDNGSGTNSKGGKANNNAGILKKLADDGTPLAVRFIGSVTAPDGLTAYDSVDYGGSVGDNGYMARMQSAANVTLEGIGSDAEIHGWGFHFIASTTDSGTIRGKSFEARNLTFWGSPEDSLGMEGQQEGSTITSPVERCWVHNCSFLPQKISNPAESDKAEGDGCCDFKRGYYMTMSYCYFKSAHKTSLIGSSDSSLQYHVTWHHNMWENCEARGPLTRNADVHIYNCWYKQQSDYCMNPRANSYIFSEYNLFDNCKNPVTVTSGAVKSYNDSFSGYINSNDATVVTDKSTTVSTSCKYANFDTNSSVSYIPSEDYILDESVADAKRSITAYTGPMKEEIITPEEADISILESDRQPAASVALPYDENLNSSYGNLAKGSQIVDNIIFNLGGATSDSVSTAADTVGQSIVFNVNTEVNISMTDAGGTGKVILLDSNGVEYLTGTGTAYNCPAGTYIIQSNAFQPAKNGSALKYKAAKISHLTIQAADSDATTVTEPTTHTTTEAVTQSTTKADSEATTSATTEEQTEGTTKEVDPNGAASMGTYVFGKNASGGDFNISTKIDNQGNISFEFRDMTSSGARTRKDDGYGNIDFTLSSPAKLTVTSTGEGLELVKSNGTTYTLDVGTQTITLSSGTYNLQGADTSNNSTISKLILAEINTSSATETTTETVTSEATTEAATEATTEAVTYDCRVVVSGGTARVGEKVSVPVSITSDKVVSAYDGTIEYDSDKLTLTNVTYNESNVMLDYNDNDGTISIAAISAADKFSLVNAETVLVFTAKASGSAAVTASFSEIADDSYTSINPEITNGTVTVSGTSGYNLGDVDYDGDIDSVDAALVLRHISGVTVLTDANSLANADCDGTSGIDMRDVIYILAHKNVTETSSSTT